MALSRRHSLLPPPTERWVPPRNAGAGAGGPGRVAAQGPNSTQDAASHRSAFHGRASLARCVRRLHPTAHTPTRGPRSRDRPARPPLRRLDALSSGSAESSIAASCSHRSQPEALFAPPPPLPFARAGFRTRPAAASAVTAACPAPPRFSSRLFLSAATRSMICSRCSGFGADTTSSPATFRSIAASSSRRYSSSYFSGVKRSLASCSISLLGQVQLAALDLDLVAELDFVELARPRRRNRALAARVRGRAGGSARAARGRARGAGRSPPCPS